jgi:hypothetical protein
MIKAMQKNFTEEICNEILGDGHNWWKNYNTCLDKDMSKFYPMVKGPHKTKLNGWAAGLMIEEENKTISDIAQQKAIDDIKKTKKTSTLKTSTLKPKTKPL